MTVRSLSDHLRFIHSAGLMATTETLAQLGVIQTELDALLSGEQNVNKCYPVGAGSKITLVELSEENREIMRRFRGLLESEGSYDPESVAEILDGLRYHEDLVSGLVLSNATLASPTLRNASNELVLYVDRITDIEDAYNAGLEAGRSADRFVNREGHDTRTR